MPGKKNQNSLKTTSTIARSDDGTVQITFAIPFSDIKKEREKQALELGKTMDVPGFRKGKAPIDKIVEQIPENTLMEKTLSKILPQLLGDAIKKFRLKPATYPKFEIIKAKENENWEVRAITCEIEDVKLGDYKKEIVAEIRSKALWTPDKANKTADEEDKGKDRLQKEQDIIKILLDKAKVKVPSLLIEEEVNTRLSKLLERLERLGLTLESYLASINKTSESLRRDYQEQSKASLALDLILNQVAIEENISVEANEIDAAINAAQADSKLTEELSSPERKRFIEVILKRRKALDFLTSLS